MIFSEKFLQIAKIKGVDQYILLDNKGNIAAQDIKNPKKACDMIFSCGRDIKAIGGNKFKYAVFSRKNRQSIIIFPLGNYSLGVIKQEDTDSFVLADIILKFLHELLSDIITDKKEGP